MAGGKQRDNLPEPLATLKRWLKSLPIAVGVMLVLAILSAVGTVIPQEHLARPEMGMSLEQMYMERFGASRYQLINMLGLTHIYYTPYFVVLLLWLSVSSMVCTWSRIKRTAQEWSTPVVERSAKYFRNNAQAIVLDDAPADATEKLTADLQSQRYRVRTKQSDGATCIYADRGFLRQWALVVLHVSVVVLLLGAIYGNLFGVVNSLWMNDNTKQTLTLDFQSGKPPAVQRLLANRPEMSYEITQDHFRIDYDTHVKLPKMYLQADTAMQEYYRYFVKQYVSRVKVERNGRVASREAIVNHPLELDGLVLYQSGYNQQGYIEVIIGGETKEYPARANIWFMLSADGPVRAKQAVEAGDISSELFMLLPIKSGELYAGGEHQGALEPMSVLSYMTMRDTVSKRQLITPDDGFTTRIGEEQAVLRLSKRVDNASSFSYKYDPGSWALYVGWTALVLGIFLSLYIPISRVYLRVEGARVFAVIKSVGKGQDAVPFYKRCRDLLSDV